MRFRTIFSVWLVSLALPVLMSAQEKSLQFLYITKDYTTKVNPLIEEIKDVYDFVTGDSSTAAIFYLANFNDPVIVKVNLPGDNRKEIETIYEILNTSSEVMPDAPGDLETIPSIFANEPLIDENGNPRFTEVELRYYIGPLFWELSDNEQIIASLWYILELDQPWTSGYVSMSIFHQDGDGLVFEPDFPMGRSDMCPNYRFFMLTY